MFRLSWRCQTPVQSWLMCLWQPSWLPSLEPSLFLGTLVTRDCALWGWIFGVVARQDRRRAGTGTTERNNMESSLPTAWMPLSKWCTRMAPTEVLIVHLDAMLHLTPCLPIRTNVLVDWCLIWSLKIVNVSVCLHHLPVVLPVLSVGRLRSSSLFAYEIILMKKKNNYLLAT